MPQSIVDRFLVSPYTALIVTLVFTALAFSGRVSVIATQGLLIAAWVVALFGLREQPLPVLLGIGAILAGAFLLLAWNFRPEAIPLYSGELSAKPKAKLLFSPVEPTTNPPRLQIGDSGVFIEGRADQGPEALLFPILEESQFKVELINGEMKVSTQIKDSSGNMVAELIRNEWKVAPPPGSWDRNYTHDTLEVLDGRGDVVLQVRVHPDRIQIQGVWWKNLRPPNGWTRVYIWRNPDKPGGAELTFIPKDSTATPPSIPRIFEYPSDRHLGELRKQS
jgi:hypothetical protein